jgi:carboxymethylenebutenolidase
MGVCATGRHPLVVAAERSDISACVVFYGAAYRREWVPKDTLSAFIERSRAPVLGVFGELDNLIAVEDVQRFRNALEAARRSYQIRLFPDAPHGWLNDTMSGRYRRPQAEDAWSVLISFLARVHAGDYPTDRVQWSFEANHSLSYDFSKNVRLE